MSAPFLMQGVLGFGILRHSTPSIHIVAEKQYAA